MANLSLKNIYKVYPNGTKAVNDFSLDIEDKEFIVFVGPSGCGKSTVLRMIAGLEEISAGELKIDDEVVNDVDCKNRDTAMVFQNYALYPHMTVADNMAFPIKMSKLTKAQKQDLRFRVDEKYPPVIFKSKCKRDAKKEVLGVIAASNGGVIPVNYKLTDEDNLEIACRAEQKYSEYLEKKSKNPQVKKQYKEGKKVSLSADDKKAIREIIKDNYPHSFKNLLLRPFHWLEVRHDYISAIVEERKLQRPISLANNIMRAAHVSLMKKSDMYEKVVQIAEILGLEEYLGKKPSAMSGGQRQRVALGRAMVRNPKVFLLDEPLSNLDAKLRTQMRSEITKLHNRLQTTFIYVTHDQVEAMTMGDRIVVMKKGRIQQTDTPLNLYSYPENLFVAGFIGTPSMNFVDAVVESDGEKASVVFANNKKLQFSAEYLKKFERKYLGKTVVMGVRPEDFVIDENGVECVVLNSEMLGSETLLYCDFDTQNVTNYENGKYPFIIKTEGVCLYKSGEKINVSVKFDKAHFFDKQSEASVMKRFVSYNDISVEVKSDVIDIGGNKVKLPPALNGLDGKLSAVFPTAAVCLGNEFKAEVLECELLKEGWLARLKVGSLKLYALFSEEVSGNIGIDLQWHKIAFYDGDKEVKSALDTENVFGVKLVKRALTKQQKKELSGELRNFDVDVVCKSVSLTCPVPVLKRLLGASDRKLFGIDLQLIFDERAIVAGNAFTADVNEVYDYGGYRYALCDCLGTKLVIPCNNNQKQINFDLDLFNSTIYDNNLGIKIT